jgi:hypothetical protein
MAFHGRNDCSRIGAVQCRGSNENRNPGTVTPTGSCHAAYYGKKTNHTHSHYCAPVTLILFCGRNNPSQRTKKTLGAKIHSKWIQRAAESTATGQKSSIIVLRVVAHFCASYDCELQILDDVVSRPIE